VTSDVIKPDGYQDVRRETWMHRTPAEFVPCSATTTADAETIARWADRLRAVVEADPDRLAPSYRIARMGVPAGLAAQVLAAYEEAE